MALMPGAGLTKEQANYRHHEQCSTCNYFYHMSSSCRIVDGVISPEAVCDRWEMNGPKTTKGKNYFESEYQKTKGQS